MVISKPRKITAPLKHKPKGAPEEHLAYLNKREMAILARRNGSKPARGPNGIPSFVETSGTKGSSSKASSSKGAASRSTANKGNWNTSTGGYSSGSKSSSPVAKSSTTMAARSATPAARSSTTMAAKTAASISSSGSAKRSAKTPISSPTLKSPMAGQGVSYSSPKAAQVANKAYTKANSFRNKVMGNIGGLFPKEDVTDLQKLKNMPQQPYISREGEYVNPNLGSINPYDAWKRYNEDQDAFRRMVASKYPDNFQKTPQEIALKAQQLKDAANKRRQLKAQAEYNPVWPGQSANLSEYYKKVRFPGRVSQSFRDLGTDKVRFGGGLKAGGLAARKDVRRTLKEK